MKLKSSQEQDLRFFPAYRLKELLLSGQISSLELTKLFLHHIEKQNPYLHAFLYINYDGALEAAAEADKLLQKKDFSKPLLGLPIVVTDALDLKGSPNTYGSLLLKDKISEDDAIEIALLKEAGAIILGKTNIAEFGLYNDTKNRLLESCKNPWNIHYSAGGPNGGGAAAVAAGLSPLALATDTVGSLRMTSSFCGLPGLLPTRGMIPTVRKYHLLPSDLLMYRKGLIAHSFYDMAMFLNVLNVHDERDRSCFPCQEDFEKAFSAEKKSLHIAWVPQFDFLPVEEDVRRSLEETAHKLEDMGHRVTKETLDFHEDLFTYFYAILSSDRFVVIKELLEDIPYGENLLTEYTNDWIIRGSQVKGYEYSLASAYITWLEEYISKFMQIYDLILLPASPVPPFLSECPPSKINNIPVDPVASLWCYTCPFNASGNPVITLPSGLSHEGLPIGVQIVGRHWEEKTLLSLAHEYEKKFPWKSLVI